MAVSSSELVTSGSLALLEGELVERIRREKRDPLAPIVVVVGSQLQHVYLRRVIARALGASANIRFLTLLDVAGLVATQPSDAPMTGTLALPDGGDALILQDVLRQSPQTYFPPDLHGIASALAATLRDLADGGVSPNALGDVLPTSKRVQALTAVGRAYEERTAGFRDRSRLYLQAVGASDPALLAALPDGPWFVYGIYDFVQVQFLLLRRIAAARPLTAFTLWDEAEPSLDFATATVELLTSAGFRRRAAAAPTSIGPGSTRMFSASDRQSEVEEVVRRVAEDVERGVPPGQIAVLHRLDQAFDDRIARALERAGIPSYLAAGRPVRSIAVGRAALALLDILCGEPTRATFLEMLSLPATDLNWVRDGLSPSPAAWEALSKEVGAVRGWEQLEGLVARQTMATDGGFDDRVDWKRERAVELLEVVRALKRLAEEGADQSWESGVRWYLGILGQLRSGDRGTAALNAIEDRVRALVALDEADVPCSPVEFADAVATALRRAVVSGGYFQRDGVLVGSVMAARWLRFQSVYLLEVSERVFPPLVREDPLLPDSERSQVNVSNTGRLPIKRRRLLEERLLFELARQAGTEQLTLSYSRRISSSSAPRQPSGFFLDQAAAIAGQFQGITQIEEGRPSWFERLPARVSYYGRDDDDVLRAIDHSDLRWHVLERWRRPSALSEVWPQLERAQQLRRNRQERRFGPYEGIVGPGLMQSTAVLQTELSASSLSDYASCPYRFFLRKVLGLRGVEEPEEILEIGAAERGTLVHRILERFILQFLVSGEPWPAFLDRAEEELRTIEDEEFSLLPAGKSGVPLSWAIVMDQVRADLRTYLAAERAMGAEGWIPISAEESFVRVEVGASPNTLLVRGKVDRIDRRGNDLRVVDYKTGSVRERADGYRDGSSLQLPIYMAAARSNHATDLPGLHAEYHYVSRRARFTRIGLDGASIAADSRFDDVVATFRNGIAGGAFFPVPGGARRPNCAFCDFSRLCHSRVADHHVQKAPDSRDLMADFRSLKE